MSPNVTPSDLQALYRERFGSQTRYRQAVWRVLISDFFAPYARDAQAVLDLGCGYGEFINQVSAPVRYAMDLNPDAARRLDPQVRLLEEDRSSRWAMADEVLDLVFTSNFFEHLPDKASLARTLAEIRRCLKPGGRLVAVAQYQVSARPILGFLGSSRASDGAEPGRRAGHGRFFPRARGWAFPALHDEFRTTLSAGVAAPLPSAAAPVESFWPAVSGRCRQSQLIPNAAALRTGIPDSSSPGRRCIGFGPAWTCGGSSCSRLWR